jgi:DNA-directed RNA polymerase subunit RPC12/RpoP
MNMKMVTKCWQCGSPLSGHEYKCVMCQAVLRNWWESLDMRTASENATHKKVSVTHGW